MIKVNKKLILLLVLALTMGVLSGCSGGLPEGIESKTFLKDMNKIYDLSIISMSEQTYYKDDINKILDGMNGEKYKEKLNDYELIMFELLLEVLIKVEEDLTTGKKMIQSTTLDEIKLIKEMLDN